MNFLDTLHESYVNWIDQMDFKALGLIIRCAMIIGFPFVACGISRIVGCTSVFVQIVIYLVGLMVGFLIPIERFQNIYPTAQAWITTFAALIIIGLPHPKGLPSLIHPWYGPQKIISFVLYTFVAVILTVGMIKG